MNPTLSIVIKPSTKPQKVSVELDAERFERLAAGLGLFREECLTSIEHSELQITTGKVRRLRSLKELALHD